jgi:hypothetical protein
MRMALLLFALPAIALADEEPNPYLNQAKTFQQGLDFEKCLKRLEQAARWNNSKAQLAQIELYGGLCELGLGHDTEALDHFELGLALDPTISLPPGLGPKTAALFQKAKAKAPKPPPQQAELKPPPKSEPEVAPTPLPPPPTPPPAAPPPEVERQQLHLVAPLTLAGISAASVIVAAIFGVQANSFQGQSRAAMYDSEAAALLQTGKTDALIANILFGVAGAAVITALIVYFALN